MPEWISQCSLRLVHYIIYRTSLLTNILTDVSLPVYIAILITFANFDFDGFIFACHVL